MKYGLLGLLLGTALLAGCAAPVHPVPTTVEAAGMPNPELALQKSITDVDSEMAELGEMNPTVTPPPQQAVLPDPLQKTVSFTWNGPLDGAVSKLAQSVGYTFYVTAPQNAQPLNVSISASETAYQVFQQLGADAGAKATVQVDPLHHQVEVIHHA
ncbi:MAG: DotD/TraH family lipoprotein [Rhodospirillales bacterium]|nr:DotD/TraH family lipoprotein [Rhodospirillales bacterium]